MVETGIFLETAIGCVAIVALIATVCSLVVMALSKILIYNVALHQVEIESWIQGTRFVPVLTSATTLSHAGASRHNTPHSRFV